MIHGVGNNIGWIAQVTRARFAAPSKPVASPLSNRPGDVVAVDTLRASLAALDAQSSANERALHMTRTSDGALAEISGMLGEVRRLVLSNSDSGTSADEKAANQLQIDAVLAGVDRLAGTTSFAGTKLLDGTAVVGASGAQLKIDSAKTHELGKLEFSGSTCSLRDLKTGGALTSGGVVAGKVIESALAQIATSRGQIGAFAKEHLGGQLEILSTAREQTISSKEMFDDVRRTMESIRSAVLSGGRSGADAQRGRVLDLLA